MEDFGLLCVIGIVLLILAVSIGSYRQGRADGLKEGAAIMRRAHGQRNRSDESDG